MSTGLKELLNLPAPKCAKGGAQAEAFERDFRDGMSRLNKELQRVLTSATHKDYSQLDSQRKCLYEAYQKIYASLDANVPGKGGTEIKRVTAAVVAMVGKATDAANVAESSHKQWQQQEADFDAAMLKIRELEDSGQQQAQTLRKLGDGIRKLANEHDFGKAVTALKQLNPKLEQIYDRCQKELRGKIGESAAQSKADTFPMSEPQSVAAKAPAARKESAPGAKKSITETDYFPHTAPPVSATAPANGDEASRKQWQQQEADFDKAMLKIRELEDSGHPQAQTLRKLGDGIRKLANDHEYEKAMVAFEQLLPKLEHIYVQTQERKQPPPVPAISIRIRLKNVQVIDSDPAIVLVCLENKSKTPSRSLDVELSMSDGKSRNEKVRTIEAGSKFELPAWDLGPLPVGTYEASVWVIGEVDQTCREVGRASQKFDVVKRPVPEIAVRIDVKDGEANPAVVQVCLENKSLEFSSGPLEVTLRISNGISRADKVDSLEPGTKFELPPWGELGLLHIGTHEASASVVAELDQNRREVGWASQKVDVKPNPEMEKDPRVLEYRWDTIGKKYVVTKYAPKLVKISGGRPLIGPVVKLDGHDIRLDDAIGVVRGWAEAQIKTVHTVEDTPYGTRIILSKHHCAPVYSLLDKTLAYCKDAEIQLKSERPEVAKKQFAAAVQSYNESAQRLNDAIKQIDDNVASTITVLRVIKAAGEVAEIGLMITGAGAAAKGVGAWAKLKTGKDWVSTAAKIATTASAKTAYSTVDQLRDQLTLKPDEPIDWKKIGTDTIRKFFWNIASDSISAGLSNHLKAILGVDKAIDLPILKQFKVELSANLTTTLLSIITDELLPEDSNKATKTPRQLVSEAASKAESKATEIFDKALEGVGIDLVQSVAEANADIIPKLRWSFQGILGKLFGGIFK